MTAPVSVSVTVSILAYIAVLSSHETDSQMFFFFKINLALTEILIYFTVLMPTYIMLPNHGSRRLGWS